MMTKTLFALIAAGGLLLAGAPGAYAQTDAGKPAKTTSPDAKKDKKSEGAKIGEPAPAFELTDTDGKTVKLADFKDKIVVLEWYNPECPVIVKHHKSLPTFNDLHKDFSGKDVVFLAINSNGPGFQGHGKDLNAKSKKDLSVPYPILLDENSTVGRAYGAETTPHVFIIAKDGTLAYKGAIDNQKKVDSKDYTNYARQALDQLIKGETVTEPETRAYGCAVKFAKKK